MEVAMPPAVHQRLSLPTTARLPCIAEESAWRPDAGEVLSGALDIVGNVPGGSRRVFVRVYRTSREHFAVLLPMRGLASACKPLASLNLRTCSVLQTSLDEFRVSPRPLEGATLCFKSPPGSPPVALWIAALQEPRHQRIGRCPGSPLLSVQKMPALLEEDMQPVC